MKICTKCKLEKELIEFFKSKNSKFGVMSECKKCNCLARYRRAKNSNKISTLISRENRNNGLKYCPKCKQTKILENFYKSGKSNYGNSSHCKECCKIIAKEESKENKENRYKKNKEKILNIKLKQKFGISLNDYQKKLTEQNYKCAICNKSEKENKKRLAVDHNHKNNKVRGLLCANCNIALGFINENIEICKNLISYINYWREII